MSTSLSLQGSRPCVATSRRVVARASCPGVRSRALASPLVATSAFRGATRACRPQLQFSASGQRCQLTAVRCSGGSPEAGRDDIVPKAPRRQQQQQAVDTITIILEGMLEQQDQAQDFLRTLLNSQQQQSDTAWELQQEQYADLEKLLTSSFKEQLTFLVGANQQLLLLTHLSTQQLELLKKLLDIATAAASKDGDAAAHAADEARKTQGAEAAAAPAPSAAGPAALQVPPSQLVARGPRLLDYVRVPHMASPVLPGGTEGVVLGSAMRGERLQVWSLHGPARCSTFAKRGRVLERIAASDLAGSSGRVQYLPYDPERQGVPVTRFTAAPGMLVRRGYDGLTGGAVLVGEVGVIQPDAAMGDRCWVEWANGRKWAYDMGYGKSFQLVHVEVSPTSGAPVVAGDAWGASGDEKKNEEEEQEEEEVEKEEGQGLAVLWCGLSVRRPADLTTAGAKYGAAVERGSHWTYGGAEPGLGVIQEEKGSGQGCTSVKQGWLTVQWPNGQLVHHRASPAVGYDLCYSARPGSPVTVFTARQGLRVITESGELGVLLKPLWMCQDGVMWAWATHPVDATAPPKTVFVGTTHSTVPLRFATAG